MATGGRGKGAKKSRSKSSASRTAGAKASGKKASVNRASSKKAGGKASVRGRTQSEKDPAGGLTARGRAAFARKEGSHLRPGVKGKADTPEKQKRKGSFLRRHFAHPRGPMVKDGEPTRLALSAHAWGEPVPKTMADAAELAAKGKKLLEQYRRSEGASRSA